MVVIKRWQKISIEETHPRPIIVKMMMMMYEEEEEIVQNAWSSELPADLLGLISDKVRSLSLSEYIKFGSVCVAWRSFSIENYQHIKLPSKLPMLLIPIPTTTTTLASNKYIPCSLSSSIEEEASEEESEASSIEEEEALALAEASSIEQEASEEEALAEASSIEVEASAEASEASSVEEEALAEASLIEEEAAEAEASEDELEDEFEDELEDEMEEEIKLPEYYNPKDIWKGQNYEQRYRSTRNLYSISEKKVYHDFGFHVPYYKNIRGSSHGWLVTVEECCSSDQGVDYYPVRLFNPFRADNNEIQLPPLNHYRVDCRPHTSYYLHKAILSANPSSLSDPTTELVVLGICTRSLAFCRPGDKYWTHLELEPNYRPVLDIICYQGEFYAILHSGYVFAFDTALFHPTITITDGLLPPQEDSLYPYRGQIKRYLVESEGELLQVRRDISISNQTNCYVTGGFLVFKRDPMDPTKWVETKTLNDRMLFLGNSSTSMSLSALEFPGCKPNSIYYTDDMEFFYYVKQHSGPHDIGVFSVEDESFLPHHGLESMIMPAPVWIQPML